LPLSEEDKQSSHYEAGISCHHCYDKVTEEQRQRFQEREKQMQLASLRGEEHIGSEVKRISEQHRQEKLQARERQREQNRPKHR
jgi:UPF0176 protein